MDFAPKRPGTKHELHVSDLFQRGTLDCLLSILDYKSVIFLRHWRVQDFYFLYIVNMVNGY